MFRTAAVRAGIVMYAYKDTGASSNVLNTLYIYITEYISIAYYPRCRNMREPRK